MKTRASEALQAHEAWNASRLEADLANRLKALLQSRGKSGHLPQTWDETVQLYLAAYALLQSSKTEELPELQSRLQDLQTKLGFPEGYQSPRSFLTLSGSEVDARKQLLDVLRNLPNR